MEFREEKDLIGSRYIQNSDYFGINTLRAAENFNLGDRTVNIRLIREIALIKKSAALVNCDLRQLSDKKASAIVKASEEIIEGKFDSQFGLSAFQGGAGTSTNMNVNEVIANRAIEILGGRKGDYDVVHPLNDVNMSQSTNDVYPTALRIASIRCIRDLSHVLSKLQEVLQAKEDEFSDIIKLGRTELMDALPMMAGQGFGAYSKAISRDRWRIYKVEERLREINIGGTAIGTGLNASRKFIYEMTDKLQNLTGFGISRSDYPMDITQNCDVFVEVSGLLKSLAVNLLKISNDLRLLGSGPRGGIGEVILPEVQAGSTIMPGKVNPVIPEMVGQVSMRVIANDSAITIASSSGQLELNAFMPLIADSLLESLEILKKAVEIFNNKCIKDIKINSENCRRNLEMSTAQTAALVHYIGYDKAGRVAKKALMENKTIKDVLYELQILPEDKIDNIINPYQLTKPGIPGE